MLLPFLSLLVKLIMFAEHLVHENFELGLIFDFKEGGQKRLVASDELELDSSMRLVVVQLEHALPELLRSVFFPNMVDEVLIAALEELAGEERPADLAELLELVYL